MNIDMVVRLLGILMIYAMAFMACRSCSAYFDEAKCSRYLTIKSPALGGLLISRTYKSRKDGRLWKVPGQNRGKMSWVGLAAHSLIHPLGIGAVVIVLLEAFQMIPVSDLSTVLFGLMAVLMVFFLIVSMINNRDVIPYRHY